MKGMRDEHSLLHVYCVGLDTTGGKGIEQNKGKQRHACVLSRLFICRTYEQHIIGPSFFPMSCTEWGGVGMAGVDLGLQCDAFLPCTVQKNEKEDFP